MCELFTQYIINGEVKIRVPRGVKKTKELMKVLKKIKTTLDAYFEKEIMTQSGVYVC